MASLSTIGVFVVASLLEIAGCYAAWAVVRSGHSAWWLVPGFLALIGFAFLLTRIDASHAGRAYAAYGGIYIAASLLWLWWAEGVRPDRFDAVGAVLCLIGASIILWAPRSA